MPHRPVARLTGLLAAVVAVVAPAASAQAPYEIPADNPFASAPGGRGEVYVYGLRNPYRWSFDRLTGDMYIGDVGGSLREEVTFLPRAASAGANLGWNCREGDVAGPGNCTAQGHVPPQHAYEETGEPVIGGYVVRQSGLGAYQGRYLFGRYSGVIRWLGAGATGTPADTGLSVPQLTSFGEDGVGQLYVTSQAGPVYRLTASGNTLGTSLVGNFAEPAAIAAPPGDADRLFVAELGGHVKLRAGGQVHDFLDIDALVDTDGERGLLAVAVAPDYATSGRVFVFYTANGGDLTLDEVRRSATDPNRADPATRRNILTIEHSAAANHNGGQLLFGPDGYLYLSTGDGGGQGDPEGDAQNVGSLLGKILRIDIDVTPGPPAPLPVLPIATDTRAPALRTRVPRRQRVLRLRGAVAYAGCNEACTITMGGVLRVRNRRLRLVRMRRVAQASQAGRRLRLKVGLKRKQARILRRALRRGRRPIVRLRLRATDPAGNRSALARRGVRVRRR